MSKTIGVFLSDIHFPDNIDINPVLKYVKDLYSQCQKNGDKFLTILGGDIIDAKGMHGVESMSASQIKLEWYDRDCKLMSSFLRQLLDIAPKTELVYIEGNHEERYRRITTKYPDAFGGRFDFNRDVVKKVFPKSKWVPYGTYESSYILGDCYFIHGTWPLPDHHAKKIAVNYASYKVVYGHMHTWQAYTLHNAVQNIPTRYAVTAGCLTDTAPEWKKGCPNMWINGFIDFTSDNGVTTPTVHLVEKGKFTIAGREYK